MENGQLVSVHYIGTLDDGSEFDNSRSRNAPLEFQLGTGQVIPGFESAISSMEVGETRDIHIEPAQAYGDVNPAGFQDVARDMFPEDFECAPGTVVQGQREDGHQFQARIVSETDGVVRIDLNHPLAGQNLNFNIEVLGVQ
jgi:peptidylprolyl isomerase